MVKYPNFLYTYDLAQRAKVRRHVIDRAIILNTSLEKSRSGYEQKVVGGNTFLLTQDIVSIPARWLSFYNK